MKRAFSLVELMVVLGIIGILVGVILSNASGMIDSARATQCLSNMRNLATACQNYAMGSGHYPNAGTILLGEGVRVKDEDNDIQKAQKIQGWLGLTPAGKMPNMYSSNYRNEIDAFKAGVLYKYLGGSRQGLICPAHSSFAKQVNFSYLMNQFFGWQADSNFRYDPMVSPYIMYGASGVGLSKPELTLLFCEVPFVKDHKGWKPTGKAETTDTDCVLQYVGYNEKKKGGVTKGKSMPDGIENIGVNHKQGSHKVAHVVFADGHVEKIDCGVSGLKGGNIKELTTWLCLGKPVVHNGDQYEEVKK